jgi:hypothetical protein
LLFDRRFIKIKKGITLQYGRCITYCNTSTILYVRSSEVRNLYHVRGGMYHHCVASKVIMRGATWIQMLKGYASWTRRNMILGLIIWEIGNLGETPLQVVETLFKIVQSVVSKQWQMSVDKWEFILIHLCSMVIVIPSGKWFQWNTRITQEPVPMRKNNNWHIPYMTSGSFLWLALDSARHFTCITELFPAQQPVTLGAKYTAGKGVDGPQISPSPATASNHRYAEFRSAPRSKVNRPYYKHTCTSHQCSAAGCPWSYVHISVSKVTYFRQKIESNSNVQRNPDELTSKVTVKILLQ